MIGIQLGLIDIETGAVLVEPEEIHEEDSYSFMQMTEIAKHYGAELGRLYAAGKMTNKEIDDRIIGFVDGLSANRGLSADERAWLRNDTLNGTIRAANGRLWDPVARNW